MIAASIYLQSTNSSRTAASSIQGTGVQNFSSAMRSGCMSVSFTAFGPHFSSRLRASTVVSPPLLASLVSRCSAEAVGILISHARMFEVRCACPLSYSATDCACLSKRKVFERVAARRRIAVELHESASQNSFSIPAPQKVADPRLLSRAEVRQTVRKLQDLGIEWRKERAGRNFGRFRPIGRLMRPERASGRPHARG